MPDTTRETVAQIKEAAKRTQQDKSGDLTGVEEVARTLRAEFDGLWRAAEALASRLDEIAG